MSSTENPNAPSDDGWTPIHVAVMEGHIEIVKLLMSVTDNPNAPNNAGTTPYTIALWKNHHDIAALFPVVGDLKWWFFMGVSLLQPLLIAFVAEMKI